MSKLFFLPLILHSGKSKGNLMAGGGATGLFVPWLAWLAWLAFLAHLQVPRLHGCGGFLQRGGPKPLVFSG